MKTNRGLLSAQKLPRGERSHYANDIFLLAQGIGLIPEAPAYRISSVIVARDMYR